MTHVPYKGAQAAYQDLIGERIDLMLDNTSTARGFAASKQVKALVVTNRDPDATMPGAAHRPALRQGAGLRGWKAGSATSPRRRPRARH